MSSKSKLLVRSHAIQESASPPPSPSSHELDPEQATTLQTTNCEVDCRVTTVNKNEDIQTNENFESLKRQSGTVQKTNYLKENENCEKHKFKSMGSSSSMEGASSGFISRESSYEQYVTDQNGVSLLQFFHETLNKNAKDRNMLLKIEKELYSLATDKSRTQVIFPPMCSYNRMLIHRVAAYFGMEHNVDATQQCVIAGVTRLTRVPDIRFKTLINDGHTEEYKRSILKRSAHSFEECRQNDYLLAQKGSLTRKTKSFEERQNNYEKTKQRIFKDSGNISMEGEWSAISSMKQDDTKPQISYTNEAEMILPDYQRQVLELLKNKRDRTFGNEETDCGLSENSCKYGALWAVTDIKLVPKGSILIDPQTLKPIVNADNTIYTYDPDNFPPNCKKYEKPIVKINDVKINIIDETTLDENVVDIVKEAQPVNAVAENTYCMNYEFEDVSNKTYYKHRVTSLPLKENQQIITNNCTRTPINHLKLPNYQPQTLSTENFQFDHFARLSLSCPYAYTMTNHSNTFSHNVPFRIPSQEFGIPLSIQSPYLTNHIKTNALESDEKLTEIPATNLTTSNISIDPRFPFCAYSPAPEYNQFGQSAPSAVINIYGQLNSRNVALERSSICSSTTKNFQSGNSALRCNSAPSSTKKPPNEIDKKQETTQIVEKNAFAAKKSLNNKLDRKSQKECTLRSKFNSSIQSHSNSFQDKRQDAENRRTQNIQNDWQSAYQYTTRKNERLS